MWRTFLSPNNEEYAQTYLFGCDTYAEMGLVRLAFLALAFPTLTGDVMHKTSVLTDLVEESNGRR